MPEDKHQNGYYTGPSREESQAEISETARTEEQRITEQGAFYEGGGEGAGEQVVGFVKRRKKGVVGFLIALLLGGGGLGGFLFFSKTFEIVHVMANFSGFHFGPWENQEVDRTGRLMQYMYDTRYSSDFDTDEFKGKRRRTGNYVIDYIANKKLLDPLVEDLREKGYTFEAGDPETPDRATRIRDPDGRVVFDAGDDGFFRNRLKLRQFRKMILKDIPIHHVGKRLAAYTLLNDFVGWSRKFYLVDEAVKKKNNAKQRIRSRIYGRGSDIDLRTRRKRQEDGDSDKQKDPYNDPDKTERDVDRIRDLDSGGNTRAKLAKLGLGATAILGASCVAIQVDESVQTARKVKKYENAIETGTVFLTMSSELKHGTDQKNGTTISANEVGEITGLLHQSAPQGGVQAQQSGEEAEEMHFNWAAGWQRATGQPATGPDLKKELRFDYKGGGAFNQIVSLFKGLPIGGDAIKSACNALETSIGSFVVNVVDFPGYVLEEIDKRTLNVKAKLLDLTVNFLSERGQTCGTDLDPVQISNCLGAALTMFNGEHSRTGGGPPLSDNQTKTLIASYFQNQAAKDRARGFVWRYLSPNNPRSLATKAFLSRPRSLEQAAELAVATPSHLVKTAVRPFTNQAYAAEQYNSYGVQQFGFTDQDINSINPVENEEFILEHKDYRCQSTDDGLRGPNGGSCNVSRWETAEKIDLYLNKCMKLPYVEAEVGSDGKLNPENPEKNWVWEKDSGGRKFRVDCDERTELYVKTGMWVYDKYLLGNMKCLTHNKPCESQARSGSSDSSPISDGQLQYPPNLSRGSCPDPYYRMPESQNGKYVIYASSARRCGQKELIGVLYTVAQNYYDKYGPGSKMYIGDLNGGAPHKSHKWGIAADLDAATNPRAADRDKGNYSTQATIDLGKMLVDTGLIKNIWWCEPGAGDDDLRGKDGSMKAIRNYAEKQGKPINLKCIKGHSTHFHIDLKLERGPAYAP